MEVIETLPAIDFTKEAKEFYETQEKVKLLNYESFQKTIAQKTKSLREQYGT